MTHQEALLPQGALPELRISASMRSAAASIAACFSAYQQSCYDLPKAQKQERIPQNLQSQRERKQAYHLALKFLHTATLKENPDYHLANHTQRPDQKTSQLQELIDAYLDRKLNALIHLEANKIGDIAYQTNDHPVTRGPW